MFSPVASVICEAIVRFLGRSIHASVADEGISPYPSLASFLIELESIQMRDDPELGVATVTPTVITCDQTSTNVLPSEIVLTCDWRNVPGETADDICLRLQAIADGCSLNGARVEVSVPVFDRVSYTGVEDPMPADNPAYRLPLDHPLVVASRAALADLIGDDEPGFWQFATDGGHFAQADMAPIGFGPGDELLAHTIREHIEIEALEIGVRGNELLARRLPEAAA